MFQRTKSTLPLCRIPPPPPTRTTILLSISDVLALIHSTATATDRFIFDCNYTNNKEDEEDSGINNDKDDEEKKQ